MAENGRKNDAKREQAAILFAEGDKTFAEIAKACQVGDRTLYRWQSDPDFKARVKELQKLNSEQTIAEGICRKDNRLHTYQDLADRIQVILNERSLEMSLNETVTLADGSEVELARVPGGKSGLLARSYDKLGREVYKFDAALARELRETLKQAAIEKGQWTEKREDAGSIIVVVSYEGDNGADDTEN